LPGLAVPSRRNYFDNSSAVSSIFVATQKISDDFLFILAEAKPWWDDLRSAAPRSQGWRFAVQVVFSARTLPFLAGLCLS
jgi:hypothetical protein